MYFHRAVYIETHPLGWVITTLACTIQAHISTVLSPTRKETSSEAYQRCPRFQQHRDASCHQGFFFPARQGAEGNSRHFDRNISLFPSWSGYGLSSTPVHVVLVTTYIQGGAKQNDTFKMVTDNIWK